MIEEDLTVDIKFIEMLLTQAKVEIDRKQDAAATQTLQLALAKLGFSYESIDVVDDTDTKIFLAEDKIEEGDFKMAANLLYKMLEVRINLYKRKFNLQ